MTETEMFCNHNCRPFIFYTDTSYMYMCNECCVFRWRIKIFTFFRDVDFCSDVYWFYDTKLWFNNVQKHAHFFEVAQQMTISFFQIALFFRSKFFLAYFSHVLSVQIFEISHIKSSSIRTWVHLEAGSSCIEVYKKKQFISERAFVILCCLTASYLAKEYIYIYIKAVSLSPFK